MDTTIQSTVDQTATTQPELTYDLLVASSNDGWIGTPTGSLPFNQRADLARFRKMTVGHVVVMGRRTLESIGKLLPGRLTVVLTSEPFAVDEWLDQPVSADAEALRRDGAPQPLIVSTLEEMHRRLPDLVQPDQTVYIVGGAQLYKTAVEQLPVLRIWRTRVHTTFPEATVEAGWARFDLPTTALPVVEHGPYAADDGNDHAYTYEVYALRS